MPPKSRDRRKGQNGPDISTEEIIGSIGFVDLEDTSGSPVGKMRTRRRASARQAATGKAPIPDVYQDMLAEVLPAQSDVSERPLKRRRTGKGKEVASSPTNNTENGDEEGDVEDEDIQFEDVLDIPKINASRNASDSGDEEPKEKQQQTAYRDSEGDDDSAEEGFDWDALQSRSGPQDGPKDLELTLIKKTLPDQKAPPSRRKVTTLAEKNLRLEIHRIHVLCLLAHVNIRNDWCNDAEVHAALKPLISKKTLAYLRPGSDLSQFGRIESLKRGLEQVGNMWKIQYKITKRGLRRSLWAEDEKHIQNYELPADAEPATERSDFRAAAKTLNGSRDLGIQLFCALLRSAGVETRLTCSLQPLSFAGSGPSMPRSTPRVTKGPSPELSNEEDAIDLLGSSSPFGSNGGQGPAVPIPARRRLGHPHAAAYHLPDMAAPPRAPPKPKKKPIYESPYPVYWVEVLDEAHQKWFPVDPLVTDTMSKPRAFEPPAADRENNMSYVIAFEEDGCARDVTRRYAKTYNAKTRKLRVESTKGGEKWWRRTMRAYSRGWQSDLDQIEDTELSQAEAREPMPKNVADFKDHPYYALERHLKRNEILTSTREVGKVAAGKDTSGPPGRKRLESIYRRRDVKIAKSADAWYRLGREVKLGEQPVKVVPARRTLNDEDIGDGAEEGAGTNLYTEDQTALYESPPIVNGRVPKNSFGNLDIYVSSMVPKGGVHIHYPEASRAARLLGIDYADALTGFEFRGRHGTAILKGIVIATEYQEGIEAVIQGFRDEAARAQEEMRTITVLKFWKRFLVSLRIKERIDTYDIEGEDPPVGNLPSQPLKEIPEEEDEAIQSDDSRYEDDYGGGFIPE
ncbi:hypothetical protein BP6252_06331 [Coleophoma cylindrospora]|uniref:Rad4-domain-containing protein n=1 Tax=Coleophoma cylindrospora TaxID=1849047 RepID=A0A3D8RMB6_9HELO|nr:hypothetical protein BP6252_06331 [Coleophoma cylindrospora]